MKLLMGRPPMGGRRNETKYRAANPFGCVVLVWVFVGCSPCVAQFNIEEPPILYSETDGDNAISDLAEKLKAKSVELEYESGTEYLRSLLAALDISPASQVLVFSKTSLQIRHISPRSPRAIYFNDDTYVAWVRGSSLIEMSTTDPQLGAAFYRVNMTPRKAYILRANYECLSCHATTLTQGVPGHTVRSVMPKYDGSIDAQEASFVTDHSSPFAERWGGWYVSGEAGEMKHMGNAIVQSGELTNRGDENLLDLKGRFQTDDWLTPYSDIVALMVLEHQTQMHNTMSRANFRVRRAQYDHEMAYGLGNPDTATPVPADATQELDLVISQAAKEVVDGMLFVGETLLTSNVKGTSGFSEAFVRRGPTDDSGRSLRDLNLKTRLLEYPCSYLIYSSAFDSLVAPLKSQVYHQLGAVLNGQNPSDEYSHLDSDTRKAIRTILQATKTDLPLGWQS
ncbi:hypothetical protein [Novipirellula artificiosorum]|uniref:Cytochrome c domain-containing protein n=1 Tax=Novipirellula artificiosorum TaxID=2528016 RepID=A0A5C6DZD1_9BACT|nr:hypothetical protein [Novipirellula artificiosorum]TWU41962.1 hypothetical protein Poly41_02580 [Novipirellula artificiosorum]